MICSAHKRRGEEVEEFNLNPNYYKLFKQKTFFYNNRHINIISEDWIKIDKYFYMELMTSVGTIYVCTYIYKLTNDHSIRY